MAPYDDLDEMRVVDKHGEEIPDDIHERPKKEKERPRPQEKPSGPKKTPYQLRKEAEERAAKIKVIAIGVVIFVAVLALLIAVGVMMYQRGNPGGGAVTKAKPAEGMTMYLNENNIPALSAEGVKGLLREAYYTVDGDLAVTLNLSNGTSNQHRLSKVNIRIFNDKDETVAEQIVEKFNPTCYVPAGGREQVYFVIDRKNVVKHDDSLSMLGTTLEITSVPIKENDSDGNGPKDIASGRTYFENIGNLPELSADGVKATIIRARYTNDGSLAITLSLSNGSEADKSVSAIDVNITNGSTGDAIAAYDFTSLDTPCTVAAMSYAEVDLIIDAPYVSAQDDPLSSLSCTVSVSASPVSENGSTL